MNKELKAISLLHPDIFNGDDLKNFLSFLHANPLSISTDDKWFDDMQKRINTNDR